MPVLLLTALLAADPAPVSRAHDVPFATADGETLRLDLDLPAGPGPHPLVVCVHGGAWRMGTRKELSGQPRLHPDYGTGGRPVTDYLAGHGFAAASVSYRLTPKHKFPAQVADAKAAIRFLRANAARYNIDPDRIGCVGFSAGGHIAALVGTADKDAGFDVGPFTEISSRVKCVVDFFGPTDLSLYSEARGLEGAFIAPLLGGRFESKPELFRRASPLEYVSKDDPPFFIAHGTADVVVPIIHSERLRDKLTAAGVPVEYHTVPAAGHGWSGDAASGMMRKDVLRYLGEKLAKGAK